MDVGVWNETHALRITVLVDDINSTRRNNKMKIFIIRETRRITNGKKLLTNYYRRLTQHYNNFLWIFIKCDLKWGFWVNCLPHSIHLNCFSTPHSYFRCLFRLVSCLYFLPQLLGQKYNLTIVETPSLLRTL